jgi:hypothetical protein
LQKKPEGQSVSREQAPWHFVPLQGTTAPQFCGTCAQLPDVHAPAGVSTAFGIVPVQDAAAPHTVPSAMGVWHKPPWHVSNVHEFPSLPHALPFARFTWTQPLTELHESVVQTFESLQFNAAPAWHTPLRH